MIFTKKLKKLWKNKTLILDEEKEYENLESLTNNTPIDSISNCKLLTLDECAISLQSVEPNISKLIEKSRKLVHSKKDLGILDLDEATSITLYTLDSDLYKLMNRALLDENRSKKMEPFVPYLKLLLTSLSKLPAYPKTTVCRGMKFNTNKDKDKLLGTYQTLLTENKALVWWNVCSTTESISVLENPLFCGPSGFRIFFTISGKNGKQLSGKNIRMYSEIGKEEEILFNPGCFFSIKGIMAAGNDLHIIQLEEINTDKQLLPFK